MTDIVDPVTGLHQTPETKKNFAKNVWSVFISTNLVFPTIGLGLACLVNWVGNYDKYQRQIAGLNAMSGF